MAGTLNTAMVLCGRPRHAHGGARQQRASQAAGAAAGKALIDHVLDRLAAAGIKRAVVNVHHKADQIEQHLAARRVPRLQISDERAALLDTGGGVKKALPRLGPGAFLIHNADSVWIEGVGSNLARLAAAWDDGAMDCLLLLALASASHGYHGAATSRSRATGAFAASASSRRSYRSPSPACRSPHPRLFEDSPEGAFSLNKVWSRAIAAGRGVWVRMDGVWMHVGTPVALAEAEQCLSGAQPV